MNAVVKTTVMDWSKFTAEEWFKQYGAYVQTCRMASGNAPDNVCVNQIYWLICENNKGYESSRKDAVICKITDHEAEEVRKLIVDLKFSTRICDSAKAALCLFIDKNVRGMSLRQMANEFKLGKTSIDNMIFAGKYFLNGHDKRLRIN